MGRGGRVLVPALLALLLAAGHSSADQATDPHAVQPERPTVATHAGTVAPGWFEVETGVEADRYEDGSHGQSIPTLLKIGLAPRLQLGIGLPAVRPPGSSLGMGDIAAGLKWRVIDGGPIVKDFAVLPSIKLASGSTASGRGTGTTDLSILAISSRDIGSVSLDLNLGYTRRSGDGRRAPRSATLWTASAGIPVWRSLGLAAECFGYPGTAGPAGSKGIVALLGGPTVAMKAWLEIDAGVIVRLTGPQPNAVYAGLVWNMGRV